MIHIHQCTFLAQGNSVWENGSTISVNRVKEIIAKKLEGLEGLSGSVRLKKLTLDLGDFETLAFNNEFVERLERSCKDLESKLRELQRTQMAEKNAEKKAHLDELIAFLYSLEYTQEVQNAIYLLESTGIAPNRAEWEEFLWKYERMFGDGLNSKLSKSLKSMLRSTKKSELNKSTHSSKGKNEERIDGVDQNHIDFLVESLDRIPMNTRWFQALDELFFKEFGSKMPKELHNRIREVYDSFEFELGTNKKKQLTQSGQQSVIELNKQMLDFFESLDDTEELELMRKLLKEQSDHSEQFLTDVFTLYKRKFGKNVSRELEQQFIRFQQAHSPIFLNEIDPSKRRRILNKLNLLKELSSSESKTKKKSKRAQFSEEEYTFLCGQLDVLRINTSWYSRLLSSYQRKFNTSMPENLQRVFLSFSRSILEPANVSIPTREGKKASTLHITALIRTLDSRSKLLPFLHTLQVNQLESEHEFLSAYQTYFGQALDAEDSALLQRVQSSLKEAYFQDAIVQNQEEFLKLFADQSGRTKAVNSGAKHHRIAHEIFEATTLESTPVDIAWISEIDARHQEIYHRNLPRKSARKLMQFLTKLHDKVKSKRFSVPFDVQKNTRILISSLREQLKDQNGNDDSNDLLQILPTEESAQVSITFGDLMAGFSNFYGRELSLKLKQFIWNQNKDILSTEGSASSEAIKSSAKKVIEKQLSSVDSVGFSDAKLMEIIKAFLSDNSDVEFKENQSFSDFQDYFQMNTGLSLPNTRKSLLAQLWRKLPKEKEESLIEHSKLKHLDNQESKAAKKVEGTNQGEAIDQEPKRRDKSSGVLHPDFVRPAIDFILEFLDQPRLPENWIKLLLDEFRKEFNCSLPSIWQDLLNKYKEERVSQQTLKSKLVIFLSQNVEMPGADQLLDFLSTQRSIDSLEALFEEYEDNEDEALPLGLKMMLHRWLKSMNEGSVDTAELVHPTSESYRIEQELLEQYEQEQSEKQSLKSRLIALLSQDDELAVLEIEPSTFPSSVLSELKKLLEFVSKMDEVDSLNSLFEEYENQSNAELSVGLKQMLRKWWESIKGEWEEGVYSTSSESTLPSIRQRAQKKESENHLSESLKAQLIAFLSQDGESAKGEIENSTFLFSAFSESKKLLEFVSKMDEVDSLNALFEEYKNQSNEELSVRLKQMLRKWWGSIKGEWEEGLDSTSSKSTLPSIRQRAREKESENHLSESLKAQLIAFLSQDGESAKGEIESSAFSFSAFSESKKLLEFVSKMDEVDSLNALFEEYKNQSNEELSVGLKQMLRKWWESIKGELEEGLDSTSSKSTLPSIRQRARKKESENHLNESLKAQLIAFLSQDGESAKGEIESSAFSSSAFSESKKLLEFISKMDEVDSLNSLFEEYENQSNAELSVGLKQMLRKWWESIKGEWEEGLDSTSPKFTLPSIRQSESGSDLEPENDSDQSEINVLHKSVDHFFETNAKKEAQLIQFLHFMIDSVPLDVCWLPNVVQHYKRQFNREIPSELFDRLMNFTNDLSKKLSTSDSKRASTPSHLFEIERLLNEVSPANTDRLKSVFDEMSLSKRAFSVVDFMERYEQRYQEEVPSNVVQRMMQVHARTVKASWNLLPSSQRKGLIESLKEVLSQGEVSKKSPHEFNEKLTFLIQVLERTPIDASWFARIRDSYETKFGSDLPEGISKCLLGFSEQITISEFSSGRSERLTQSKEQSKSKNINLKNTTTETKKFRSEKKDSQLEIGSSREVDFHLESKRFLSSKWEQFQVGWIKIDQIRKEYKERFNREIPRDVLEVFESKLATEKDTSDSLSREIDQFLRKNGTNEQIILLSKLIKKTTGLTRGNWFESILNAHKSTMGSSLPLDAQQLLLRFADQKNGVENQEKSNGGNQWEKWKKEQVLQWKKYVEKVQAQLRSEENSEGLQQLDFISKSLTKSLLTEKEITLLELAFQKRFHQPLLNDWKDELVRISESTEGRIAKQSSMGKMPISARNEQGIQLEKKPESFSHSIPEIEAESLHGRLVKHIQASALSTEKSTLIELVKQLPKDIGNAWFQQLLETYKARKNANMPAPAQGVLLTFMQENSPASTSVGEESESESTTTSQLESISEAGQTLEKLLSKGLATSFKEVDLPTFFSKMLEVDFKQTKNFNRSFKLWFVTDVPGSIKRTLNQLHSNKNDLKSRLINFLISKNIKGITQLVRSLEKLTKDNWIEQLNQRCIAQFKRSISPEEQKVLLSFAANDEFTVVQSKADKFDLAHYDQMLKDLIQYAKSNHQMLTGLNERYYLIKTHVEMAAVEKKLVISHFTEGLRQKFKVYFNQELSSKDLKMMIETVQKTEKKGASRSRLRPSKPSQRKMISNKMKLIRLREELKAIKEGKELEEPTVVNKAGLVFGWVFWKSIFEGFSWLDDGRFIHTREKDTAVLAANWLHSAVNEYETVNPLILYICGLDEKEFEHLSQDELEQEMNGESLTQSIQGYYEMILSMWPIFALENLSDFIALFVEREALILESPVGIKLKLVKEPIDALTEKYPVPWPVSMINFSWSTQIIEVEW